MCETFKIWGPKKGGDTFCVKKVRGLLEKKRGDAFFSRAKREERKLLPPGVPPDII